MRSETPNMSYHPALGEIHELSIASSTPQRADRIELRQDIHATMRDGTRLMADVYIPASLGPVPTIVIRQPYGRRTASMGFETTARFFAGKGYACLVQDVRGKFSSEGEFEPGANEVSDGYDTIDWVVDQDWCNGSVGMWGESYYGFTAYAAAISGHPALACIAPGDIGVDRRATWVRQGAFLLNTTGYWALAMDAPEYADLAGVDPYHLPLIDLPSTVNLEGRFYRTLLAQIDNPDWWEHHSLAHRLNEVRIPVLCWGGWYDNYIGAQLSDYRQLMSSHPDPQNVHLFIGPWDHEGSAGRTDRAVCHTVPDTNAYRWDTYQRFFDRYLMGTDNAFGSDGTVCVFTIGSNSWRHLQSWPPPDVAQTPVYLREGYALSFDAPQRAAEPAEYSYDPSDPVPETVGRCCWELCTALSDRRWLDKRDDILRYVSAPLPRDLELAGPITAELYASTSAVDTDFTVTLCDVFSDGTVNTIQDGIIRARYRDGLSEPKLVEPGRIYRYVIDLSETNYVVPQGHRLRVDVSSSNFDRYDRNLNDGAPTGSSHEPIVARQAIHQSVTAASRLLLSTRGLPRPRRV